MYSMKAQMPVLLLAIASVMQPANAQQRTSVHESTFTAPGSTFRFRYPSDFQVCTKGKIQPCIQTYIPICQEDALVCITYPAEEFKDTNFGAASFQVREISSPGMTADRCATPQPLGGYPEFLISAEHPVEMIGGQRFIHGVTAGAAMSHWISVDLYRGLDRNRCFELSISKTETDPQAYDPPIKTLTPAQQKKLGRTMSDILHSFRFGE